MNEKILELMKSQHEECMDISRQSLRLQELLAAEQKVSNVRTAMLDETLKKLLVAITDFGVTAKDLLEELK